MCEIAEISDELENLYKSTTLPDITGETVHHKIWKNGTVLNCSDGIIEIQFDVGSKKMQYPDCVNKFITLTSVECENLFEEYTQNMQKKKDLEEQLTSLQNALEKL